MLNLGWDNSRLLTISEASGATAAYYQVILPAEAGEIADESVC